MASAKTRKSSAKRTSNDGLTWADVNEPLLAGAVPGVPAGTDLEEFLWQKLPETRAEIERDNPDRIFEPWPRPTKTVRNSKKRAS